MSENPETILSRAIKEAVGYHPKVAFIKRNNSGFFNLGTKLKPRWFRAGWKGALDLTGMMKDGRRLEIEVKVPGKKPTEEQENYIHLVKSNGGVAGWCNSVDGALKIINQAIK